MTETATHTPHRTFNAAAFAERASIREGWALRVAAADPSPVPPPTMGHYGPIRLRPKVTIVGQGADAVATVETPGGVAFTIDADDWFRLVRAFGGVEMPAIYARPNRQGRQYLYMALPPEPGASKGIPVTVARLLAPLMFGPEALRTDHVRYRDGNPSNLTRANLMLKDRKAAAAEAGA